jgi:hypothetical protein
LPCRWASRWQIPARPYPYSSPGPQYWAGLQQISTFLVYGWKMKFRSEPSWFMHMYWKLFPGFLLGKEVHTQLSW